MTYLGLNCEKRERGNELKTMTQLILAAYKGKYRAQKEIDKKQLEIAEITHRMSGLARSGTVLTKEQEKSFKPMPHTVSPGHSDAVLVGLISKKDELEREIDFLVMSKLLAERIDRLPMQDQLMIYDLYHSNKCADKVAEEYGYTKKSMYRRIYSLLDNLC